MAWPGWGHKGSQVQILSARPKTASDLRKRRSGAVPDLGSFANGRRVNHSTTRLDARDPRKQRLTSAGAKAAEAMSVERQVVRSSSFRVGTPVSCGNQRWR
jgi:hypothetical protein